MWPITHGLSKHPLYRVWRGIKLRCYIKSATGYDNYGGRGVRMCEEWRNDFKAFYDWCISNGWKHGLDIDKDIKGNSFLYSPETCLIVTNKQNCNKRKSNRILSFNGKKQTISEWSDEIGISRNTIRMRINKHGWSIEDALTTKPRFITPYKRNNK